MKVTLPQHTDKQLAKSLPFKEQQRLEMVRHYEILDTFPEESFERLTRLAATIFATPIALISLLDHGRQWFKSNYGLDVGETPLDVSFCRHAIEEDGVMVITDATKDQRFADNPLVTGDPHIRFYAGAPLHLLDGPKIGTLCVIDRIPRKTLRLTEMQILTDLAAVVVDEMELRLSLRQAKRRAQGLRSDATGGEGIGDARQIVRAIQHRLKL